MWVKLGQPWFERFVEQEPKFLSSDERMQVDGLAQGQYDMLLMVNATVLDGVVTASKQGLPVAVLQRTLIEGDVTVGVGDAQVMDQAAHPRTSQLFINRLHSQEGQF